MGGRRLTSSRSETRIPRRDDWRDSLPAALGCTGRSAELIHEHQYLLTLDSGTDIFAQDSQPEAICLLLRGNISIVGSIGLQEAVLGEITSGMLCDIGACVLGSPHNYTARSLTPCDLAMLPIDVWQRLVETFPSVLIPVVDQLSADLGGILRHIASR